MGVSSVAQSFVPSQKGKLGDRKGARRKRCSQPQSKHGLCILPSRTEGSGCSQQGAKFVSCLIFFMAKQMPVSVVLTQVPEKRGEVHVEHKLPFLSQPCKNRIFPRWLVPTQIPSVSSCMRVEEGVEKVPQTVPQIPMGRRNGTWGRKTWAGSPGSRELASLCTMLWNWHLSAPCCEPYFCGKRSLTSFV